MSKITKLNGRTYAFIFKMGRQKMLSFHHNAFLNKVNLIVDFMQYSHVTYNCNISYFTYVLAFEPRHKISNDVECATNKASDQPVHMHRLIRGFASRLRIL